MRLATLASASFTALILAFGAQAQPGAATADPARLEGGEFAMDPAHARVLFSFQHMGFSTSSGYFTAVDAKLHFDPKAVDASRLEVSVKLDGIDTTVAMLDEHLKGADFFDVAHYPVATFKSTKIVVTGPATGAITGDLTLHGVTKPVVLEASFNGGGTNPMSKAYVLGFNAVGHLKRSDYGLGGAVPMVGDEVTLTISAEFDRAKS